MNRRSPRMEGPEVPREPRGSGSKIAELEAEVALYRHSLERAREEFQAFAYSVSHDLRAPLRAIEGFSKILIEDFTGELTEDARRFLQHITSNTQLLGTQIDDLLRFYRAGKNPPTKIEVNADGLCREALIGLNSQVRPNVTIIQHELPSVSADPVQLREIFSHLLSNALKFTRNNSEPKIEIGAKVEPVAMTFYVRDNGVGFDKKGTDRLFQVFQKLHSASEYPGNGMNLAIVRRLVEAHGGCVSADSQPGQGAVFCFSLPRDSQMLSEPPKCELASTR